MEWLQGARLDVLGLHPDQSQGAANAVDTTIKMLQKPEGQAFRDRLVGMGFNFEYELHAMSWLLPRQCSASIRIGPDELERVSGLPTLISAPPIGSPLAYVEERVALLASKLTPTSGRYFFWTDDMEEAGCRCGDCRRLTGSDQAMLIYNTFLRGVRRHDPEAVHCYLALITKRSSLPGMWDRRMASS